ncbi:vomeronasal type-1 receptor 4-like [Equus quagga]|uniref:vomeronasal type-1 receptor 4-like n=1 Tax=Equus quagga TaxID=89248 RepID=UPI001EE2842F|nr:vomeronasal type-1 receptor 4-like [Equus quagga]
MIHVAHTSYSPAGSSSSEDTYKALRTDRMAARDLAVGMIFLLQTTFGILGNFFLICHYLFLYLTGCRIRSTDLIIKNQTVANLLLLFASGIRYTLSSFGVDPGHRYFECRFLPYVRAVGRGVSIGTTCLFSVIQAIIISPRNSRLAEIKVKALRCIVPLISLCWMLHMLINIVYPMFMAANRSHKNITNRKSFGYCSAVHHDKARDNLYAALLSFPDVFCLGLMFLASGSIVFILYRHKQRVQRLHKTNVSLKTSPESRATKTVLLLVSTFVLFNTLSSIFQALLALLNNPNWFFLKATSVSTLCFPSLSPFLLMSRESSVSRLCFAWTKHTKSFRPAQ